MFPRVIHWCWDSHFEGRGFPLAVHAQKARFTPVHEGGRATRQISVPYPPPILILLLLFFWGGERDSGAQLHLWPFVALGINKHALQAASGPLHLLFRQLTSCSLSFRVLTL